MNNIISVKNLAISFSRFQEKTKVIKDISFNIKKQKTTALVGESGSGKSVTAMSILRLHDEKNVSYQGEIRYQKQNILTMDLAQVQKVRGKNIAMIFQEPSAALNPLWTIGAGLIESISLHERLNKKQKIQRAIELLEMVQIKHADKRLRSYPHMLSGGQKQRIMIAMALAAKPDLLIADEPTTALDISTQSKIMELLHKIQQTNKMAILLITHNLPLVKNFSQDIIVMQDGKIKEQNSTTNIFNNPTNEYTKKLLAANKLPISLTNKKNKNIILSVANLSKKFKIKKGFFDKKPVEIQALDKISFTITKGATLGVVGESGCGKSTLAKCLLNLIDFDGVIKFLGYDIQKISKKQMQILRKDLQIVFQDPVGSLSPRLNIKEIITEGLDIFYPQNSKDTNDLLLKNALQDVQMPTDIAFYYPHEFSGGQRQRIAIARALILKPSLIVLDEPTSALDATVQKSIIKLLQSIQKKHNITYIFISHDLNVIRSITNETIVLKDGLIVEHDTTKNIFSCPQHSYTKTLVGSIL
jgi:microcin C transport system ATP-binding protein